MKRHPISLVLVYSFVVTACEPGATAGVSSPDAQPAAAAQDAGGLASAAGASDGAALQDAATHTASADAGTNPAVDAAAADVRAQDAAAADVRAQDAAAADVRAQDAPALDAAAGAVVHDTCEALTVTAAAKATDILIVLDRSGSMVGLGDAQTGKNRWLPAVSAVKKLTSSLTDSVAFGLMVFPSPATVGSDAGISIPGLGTLPSGGGNTCTPGKVDVPVALHTAGQIASVLDMSTPDFGATPTSASLAVARMALAQSCPSCAPTQKYILLITDGQPNCGMSASTTEPEDIEATSAAIDELARAGVKTHVVGFDTASDPAVAAVMDQFAMHGGTEKHHAVADEATLVAELASIAGGLVPCEFELASPLVDPAQARVEIDGVPYSYGADWIADGSKLILRPDGKACPLLRDGNRHELKYTRMCDP